MWTKTNGLDSVYTDGNECEEFDEYKKNLNLNMRRNYPEKFLPVRGSSFSNLCWIC